MITRRRLAVLLVLGLMGVGLLGRPLEAQEPTDTARVQQRRAEPEDDLRLEVKGRPPTPQVLTVRPRGEPDWTRSMLDLVGRAHPAIIGAPPPLDLRVVPVEIPTTHGELDPDAPEANDEDTERPTAGRPGTRDPPDLR